jgi:hypothetical protein
MGLQFIDRVRVTTATTGTGAIAIGAAVAGYQGFSGMAVGNTAYYTIEDGSAWEIGLGTLSASGTWTRTTVIATSAGNTSPISLDGNAILYLGWTAEAISLYATTAAPALTSPSWSGGASGDTLALSGRATVGGIVVGGNGATDPEQAWTSYTVTVSAASGTITTYTASGRYLKIGRRVDININITVSNNGTGAAVLIASLPFESADFYYNLSGHEIESSGLGLSGTIGPNSATVSISTDGNGYPVASSGTSVIVVTGAYEAIS